MRIVKPSATLMKHDCTPYEFIEKVGRTCYKSEDKITEGSAERFVKGLAKSGHHAMLEHETLYVCLSTSLYNDLMIRLSVENISLKFFNVTDKNCVCLISGSFRSFLDLFCFGRFLPEVQALEFFMQKEFPLIFGEQKPNSIMLKGTWGIKIFTREEFLKEFNYHKDILFKHLTHTFKFVCDRGVTHEFVRHRVASFAQESTRYCNYAKDKFGNEITVIEPCFWGVESTISLYKEWFDQCFSAEKSYFRLLEMGATPQEARSVLPNSLKTELIVTATEEEWQHIVNLRYIGTTGAPHPQIREVMRFAVPDLILESNGRINLDKENM